jgi:alanine-glyoxylate transaminase/serine-glyoxylate transaminase/serine-pyruvate transaminase
MDECQAGLRYLFQTQSKYVLLISGTGHAGKLQADHALAQEACCQRPGQDDATVPWLGMEAAIANMLEPGETIVVGNNGIWGQRVTDLAARYGGAGLCLLHSAPSTQHSHSCV